MMSILQWPMMGACLLWVCLCGDHGCVSKILTSSRVRSGVNCLFLKKWVWRILLWTDVFIRVGWVFGCSKDLSVDIDGRATKVIPCYHLRDGNGCSNNEFTSWLPPSCLCIFTTCCKGMGSYKQQNNKSITRWRFNNNKDPIYQTTLKAVNAKSS